MDICLSRVILKKKIMTFQYYLNFHYMNTKPISLILIICSIKIYIQIRLLNYIHSSIINESKIDTIKEDFRIKIKELKIKNSKEWFNYIKENCPMHSVLNLPFNYYSEINNNTFKKEPNLNDVAIFYDIK